MQNSSHQLRGRNAGPRLYHKKSKSGCATCKRRRVKCDEKRPSCTGCSRHGVACVYPTMGPGVVRRESRSPGPSSSSHGTTAGRSPGLEFGSPSHAQQAHDGMDSTLSETSSTISTSQARSSDSHSAPAKALSYYPAPPAPFYYPPFRPPNSNGNPKPTSGSSSSSDPFAPSIPDPPECADRRLWELRLLHNYIEIMRTTYHPQATAAAASSPPVEFPWTTEVALLALQDSAVLYAVLAQSALNLWTRAASEAERNDARTLQTTYLAMALREQRASIARLTRATADRVCMASLVILHHSYALVQTTVEAAEVEGGGWQPPVEWLRVGRGTGRVLTVAEGLMTSSRRSTSTTTTTTTTPTTDTPTTAGMDEDEDDPARSKYRAFLRSKPVFDMDEIFAAENREPYLWLLDDPEPRDEDDTELEGQVTRWVYHSALSYIGWTERAVDAGEAAFAIQRRLAAFAVWMPDLFEEFCQQRRPRALVVLAWFFRLWIPYGHRWEVNGVGERMVRGIYGVIEEKWRGKLEPIMREYGL